MNRQDRARESRRRLLVAAAELFDERGFTGTDMRELIDRSGLPDTAVYFQFPTKESVARELMTMQQELWRPMVVEARQVRDSGPLTALDVIIGVSFLVARRFRDDVVTRAGARLSQERASIEPDMPGPFEVWIDQVAELLALAQAEGSVIVTADPVTVARVIVASCYGIQQMSAISAHFEDIEERVAEMWPLLLGGVCQPKVNIAVTVRRARVLADRI